MLNGDEADNDFEFSVNAILSGHAQDVKFVKWHPTKNLLFSASYDNTIKCWKYSESVDDWLCEYTMEGHLSTVWNLDFDPTGNFLCSCSEDRKWSIWHILDNDFKNKGIIPNCHMRSIYSISWTKGGENQPQQDLIATGAADNRICVFEISRKSLYEQNSFEYSSPVEYGT